MNKICKIIANLVNFAVDWKIPKRFFNGGLQNNYGYYTEKFMRNNKPYQREIFTPSVSNA